MKTHILLTYLFITVFGIYAASNIEIDFDNKVDSKHINDILLPFKEELTKLNELKDIKAIKYTKKENLQTFPKYEKALYTFNTLGYLTNNNTTSKDKYKENIWNYEYKYDIENRLIKEKTEREQLRLSNGEIKSHNRNIIIELYEYDIDGNLISKIDPETITGTTFIYDDKQRLTRRQSEYSNGRITTFSYIYNDKDKVTMVNIEYTNENGIEKQYKKVNYIDEKNISIELFSSDDSLLKKNIIKYDDKNRAVLKQELSVDTLIYQYNYEYDRNDNLILNVSKYCGSNWGSQWFGKEVWEYDSESRLVNHYKYNEDMNPETDNYELSHSTNYTYSDNKKTIVSIDTINNMFNYTKEYTYNNGLTDQIKYSTYSSNGEVYKTEVTNISYSKGRIYSETTNNKGEVVDHSELIIEYY